MIVILYPTPQLSSVALFRRVFLAFHVPTILALHLSLGAYYKPEHDYRLIVAYPEFHIEDSYSSVMFARFGVPYIISDTSAFRPVHSQVRQSLMDILTIDNL